MHAPLDDHFCSEIQQYIYDSSKRYGIWIKRWGQINHKNKVLQVFCNQDDKTPIEWYTLSEAKVEADIKDSSSCYRFTIALGNGWWGKIDDPDLQKKQSMQQKFVFCVESNHLHRSWMRNLRQVIDPSNKSLTVKFPNQKNSLFKFFCEKLWVQGPTLNQKAILETIVYTQTEMTMDEILFIYEKSMEVFYRNVTKEERNKIQVGDVFLHQCRRIIPTHQWQTLEQQQQQHSLIVPYSPLQQHKQQQQQQQQQQQHSLIVPYSPLHLHYQAQFQQPKQQHHSLIVPYSPHPPPHHQNPSLMTSPPNSAHHQIALVSQEDKKRNQQLFSKSRMNVSITSNSSKKEEECIDPLSWKVLSAPFLHGFVCSSSTTNTSTDKKLLSNTIRRICCWTKQKYENPDWNSSNLELRRQCEVAFCSLLAKQIECPLEYIRVLNIIQSDSLIQFAIVPTVQKDVLDPLPRTSSLSLSSIAYRMYHQLENYCKIELEYEKPLLAPCYESIKGWVAVKAMCHLEWVEYYAVLHPSIGLMLYPEPPSSQELLSGGWNGKLLVSHSVKIENLELLSFKKLSIQDLIKYRVYDKYGVVIKLTVRTSLKVTQSLKPSQLDGLDGLEGMNGMNGMDTNGMDTNGMDIIFMACNHVNDAIKWVHGLERFESVRNFISQCKEKDIALDTNILENLLIYENQWSMENHLLSSICLDTLVTQWIHQNRLRDIHELHLINCGIQKDHVPSLRQFLFHSTGVLTHLELAFNHLDDEFCLLLCNQPKQCALQHLNVSNNSIGNHGIHALVGFLTNFCPIVNVNFMYNIFQEEGMQTINHQLFLNPLSFNGLQFLSLSGNPIGDAGILQFSKSLLSAKAMQGIHLASCNLTDQGLMSLLDGIYHLIHLFVLDVSNNQFTKQVISIASLHLSRHASLKEVYLGRQNDLEFKERYLSMDKIDLGSMHYVLNRVSSSTNSLYSLLVHHQKTIDLHPTKLLTFQCRLAMMINLPFGSLLHLSTVHCTSVFLIKEGEGTLHPFDSFVECSMEKQNERLMSLGILSIQIISSCKTKSNQFIQIQPSSDLPEIPLSTWQSPQEKWRFPEFLLKNSQSYQNDQNYENKDPTTFFVSTQKQKQKQQQQQDPPNHYPDMNDLGTLQQLQLQQQYLFYQKENQQDDYTQVLDDPMVVPLHDTKDKKTMKRDVHAELKEDDFFLDSTSLIRKGSPTSMMSHLSHKNYKKHQENNSTSLSGSIHHKKQSGISNTHLPDNHQDPFLNKVNPNRLPQEEAKLEWGSYPKNIKTFYPKRNTTFNNEGPSNTSTLNPYTNTTNFTREGNAIREEENLFTKDEEKNSFTKDKEEKYHTREEKHLFTRKAENFFTNDWKIATFVPVENRKPYSNRVNEALSSTVVQKKEEMDISRKEMEMFLGNPSESNSDEIMRKPRNAIKRSSSNYSTAAFSISTRGELSFCNSKETVVIDTEIRIKSAMNSKDMKGLAELLQFKELKEPNLIHSLDKTLLSQADSLLFNYKEELLNRLEFVLDLVDRERIREILIEIQNFNHLEANNKIMEAYRIVEGCNEMELQLLAIRTEFKRNRILQFLNHMENFLLVHPTPIHHPRHPRHPHHPHHDDDHVVVDVHDDVHNDVHNDVHDVHDDEMNCLNMESTCFSLFLYLELVNAIFLYILHGNFSFFEKSFKQFQENYSTSFVPNMIKMLGNLTMCLTSFKSKAFLPLNIYAYPNMRNANELYHSYAFWKRESGVKSEYLVFSPHPLPVPLLVSLRSHEKKTALRIFKSILTIMGDKKSKTKQHISEIIHQILTAVTMHPDESELRNEIYLHIFKQLGENRNVSSCLRGWILLRLLLVCICPTSSFLHYRNAHLGQLAHAHKKAFFQDQELSTTMKLFLVIDQCIHHIHSEKTKYIEVPSIGFCQQLFDGTSFGLEIELATGKKIKIDVTLILTSNAGILFKSLMNVSEGFDWKSYAFYIRNNMSQQTLASNNTILGETYSKEDSLELVDWQDDVVWTIKSDETSTLMLLPCAVLRTSGKLNCFDPLLQQYHLDSVYSEISRNIALGQYFLSTEAVSYLACFHFLISCLEEQIEFPNSGGLLSSILKSGNYSFLSKTDSTHGQDAVKLCGLSFEMWLKQTREYGTIQGPIISELKQAFLYYAQIWPLYGCRFFKGMLLGDESINVFICINGDGIYLVDRVKLETGDDCSLFLLLRYSQITNIEIKDGGEIFIHMGDHITILHTNHAREIFCTLKNYYMVLLMQEKNMHQNFIDTPPTWASQTHRDEQTKRFTLLFPTIPKPPPIPPFVLSPSLKKGKNIFVSL